MTGKTCVFATFAPTKNIKNEIAIPPVAGPTENEYGVFHLT